MTADWRATLERVAELLGRVHRIVGNDALAAEVEASEALLRGLLAEPQPDEPSAESKLARLADLTEGLPFEETDDDERLIERAIQLAWFHLAEPQVNPSEAKRFTEADIDRIYRRLDGGTWGTTSKDAIKAVLHAAGVALAEPQVNPSEAKDASLRGELLGYKAAHRRLTDELAHIVDESSRIVSAGQRALEYAKSDLEWGREP